MLTQNLSSVGMAGERSFEKTCADFQSLLVFLCHAAG